MLRSYALKERIEELRDLARRPLLVRLRGRSGNAEYFD
jgi:hypothetical protein